MCHGDESRSRLIGNNCREEQRLFRPFLDRSFCVDRFPSIFGEVENDAGQKEGRGLRLFTFLR